MPLFDSRKMIQFCSHTSSYFINLPSPFSVILAELLLSWGRMLCRGQPKTSDVCVLEKEATAIWTVNSIESFPNLWFKVVTLPRLVKENFSCFLFRMILGWWHRRKVDLRLKIWRRKLHFEAHNARSVLNGKCWTKWVFWGFGQGLFNSFQTPTGPNSSFAPKKPSGLTTNTLYLDMLLRAWTLLDKWNNKEISPGSQLNRFVLMRILFEGFVKS